LSDISDLGHEVTEDDAALEEADRRGELPELIEELIGIVERAKSMPLSSSAIISRDEVLGLLLAARDALPVELLNARRMLQDHEGLRQRAEREADELLDEARSQAQYMVQRTEVVRQARHHAERLVEEAEADARRVRHEADDYVDRRLAAFEIVLDRTMRTVRAGRERLAVVPDLQTGNGSDGVTSAAEDAFFDQDLT
jgi:cell division septum initiation protein DivIVA